MIDDLSFFQSGNQTDKITQHGYHRIYPWFLNHFRGIKNLNLLEIGVADNGSIKLWSNFFDNPNITVMDIVEKDVGDASFVLLDQSDEKMLIQFASNNLVKFDVIIDDGSHVPAHQFVSLVNLWKTLKPGGVYIVEDIETSYWGKSEIYGYKFDSNKFSFIEKIIGSVQNVNSEFIQHNKIKEKTEIDALIEDAEIVSFAYNSIIFVKKSNKFINYYNRPYRLFWKINNRGLLKRIYSKLLSIVN